MFLHLLKRSTTAQIQLAVVIFDHFFCLCLLVTHHRSPLLQAWVVGLLDYLAWRLQMWNSIC